MPTSDKDVEIKCIKNFFAAKNDEQLRKSFIAALPWYYNPASSAWIEEFLVYHLEDLKAWMREMYAPGTAFLHRSAYCLMHLTERKDEVMQQIYSYYTAVQPQISALIAN